jgi:hypothetical protein
MTKRDAKCGTPANEGELARIELRALGHRDAPEWSADFCIGYLAALKDQERAERAKGMN